MIGKMIQGFLVGMVIGVLGACTSPSKTVSTETNCADAVAAVGDKAPTGVARKTTKTSTVR